MASIWSPVLPRIFEREVECDIDEEAQIQMPICRICFESNPDNMIEPCSCKGTIAKVHRYCLEQWLFDKEQKTCELCSHQYHFELVPRYRIIESIGIWSEQLSTRKRIDIILTAVWTLVMLAAAIYILISDTSFHGIYILLVIIIIDLILFTVRLIYLIRKYFIRWHQWRNTQLRVRL